MSGHHTRREFLRTATAATAVAAALPLLPRPGRALARHRAPALVARPFDLHKVRLLPSVFRDNVDVNQKYLMHLDPDRLLYSFRATAGLPTPGQPYLGWEAPNNELRGHFVGHYISGCALMAAQMGDAAVKARGDLVVSELAKCQRQDGYLSAFPDEFFERLKARATTNTGRGVWAPFYTIHKLMAGLLDSYTLGQNAQALTVLKGMADWTRKYVDTMDNTVMQRLLNTEFGGMAETLVSLAGVTGDNTHLDTAKRFDHERILAPLAEGRDELRRVHANTTIPKVLAASLRYEMTGEQRQRDIASYFWNEVTSKRCFATGGSSSAENFQSEPGKLSTELSSDTEESCVSYNLLKLTRHIFSWTADPRAADYYERALYNSMLGTQHPADGEKIYYMPMASGYWRMFGTSDEGFWCCHGSGVESHSKFGDSIYFQDDQGVFVNLYIPSELDYVEKSARLVQETSFPTKDSSRITVHVTQPTQMAIRVRIPYWTSRKATVKVNGGAVKQPITPSSYVSIDRQWKNGDTIDVTLPMHLHAHPMPDDPTIQAVMYGPLVLAGKLGPEPKRAPPTRPRMTPDFTEKPVAAPVIKAKSADPASWVKMVDTKKLEFKTVGQEKEITLAPFNGMYDERYVVYWNVNKQS